MKETIASLWESYWQSITAGMAHEYHAVQKLETQKAFYAGIFGMLCITRDLGSDSYTEDEGVARLQALWEECQRFYESIGGSIKL